MFSGILVQKMSAPSIIFANVMTLDGRTLYESPIDDFTSEIAFKPHTKSDATNPFATFMAIAITYAGSTYMFFVSTYSGKYLYIYDGNKSALTSKAVSNVLSPNSDVLLGSYVNAQGSLFHTQTAIAKLLPIQPPKIWFNIHAMTKLRDLERQRSPSVPMSLVADALSVPQFDVTSRLTYSMYTPEGYRINAIQSNDILTIANLVLATNGITRTSGAEGVVAWDRCNESRKPIYLLIIGSAGVGKSYAMKEIAIRLNMRDPIHISYDNPAPHMRDYLALADFQLTIGGQTYRACDPVGYQVHYPIFSAVMELIKKTAAADKIDLTTEKADLTGMKTRVQEKRAEGYDVMVAYAPSNSEEQRFVNMANRFLTEGRYGKVRSIDAEFPTLRAYMLAAGLKEKTAQNGMIVFV